MDLQSILTSLKDLLVLFIFVIVLSYYVLLLLIFAHNICYLIFKNKPSMLNYFLFMFLIAIGTYSCNIVVGKIYTNKNIIKTGFLFEGIIISIYSILVDDAHLKMFVLHFLDFWDSINSLDKNDKVKYKDRGLKTLMKTYGK